MSQGLQGLQNHSIGDMYPLTIEGVGNGKATQYRVFNTCTGARGRLWNSQREAIIDMHGIGVRNMMHG